MTLTLLELRNAAAWAEQHVREVHAGDLPFADIRFIQSYGSGIGVTTHVLCEACDRVKVARCNHHDVTDHEAW